MGSSSVVGADDKEELKRQYRALIGKTKVGALEVTGREVAEWVKDGHRFGKAQGEIRDVVVLTGTKQDFFFVVIELAASDTTAIHITCWKVVR